MYREDRESVILTLFGSSPKARILDLFLDNPLFEFTRNEIIQAIGIAKTTLYRTLPELEESGVIVESRRIGKASLYRLNDRSPVVQSLKDLIRSYSRAMTRREVIDALIEPEMFEEVRTRG